MARMTIEPNEDGVRIAPLGELDDFEVAQGYPDVRGWKVLSSDGKEVGVVHELLIDVDNLRTRYLDVRLSKELAATPVSATCSYRSARRTSSTTRKSSAYHSRRSASGCYRSTITDTSPGCTKSRCAATSRSAKQRPPPRRVRSPAPSPAPTRHRQREFYDDEGYDDKRFFGERRAPYTEVPGSIAHRPLGRRTSGHRS